ncbi:MAG TPA: geranylgeranyl reductase family protein [Casimicrobiaceae bacterium]
MRVDYDVIVVGAGPGGSAAATELARSGARVALFEQEPLPRYKPCGGCLSQKIERILEPDFHSLVEKTVYGAHFTFEGVDDFRAASDRPIAYMVMRDRFDHFLAEKARAAGADLRAGERVLEALEEEECVRVRTKHAEFSARYVVGADGAGGVVGRSLKLAPRRRLAVCVEAEVSAQPGSTPEIGDEVRLAFGVAPFGYGWVFPKRDHWSIGVGGVRDKTGNPRAWYDEFLVDQDLADIITDERRRGYVIPLFAGGGSPLGSRRALLVGDAAALVDPLLGEGIYYAVRSGQLAAQALAAALSDGAPEARARYAELIDTEIYGDFRPALKMAWVLYAFPRASYAFLKRRRAFIDLYFGVLRGEAGYADLWRGLKRYAAQDLLRSPWPASRPVREVAEHYDRLARRYDASLGLWRALVSAPAWQALGELLAQSVRPGATVLDAGTGTGEATALLLARANPGRVLAVDVSKGMLHAARKKIADARVGWAQHDITSLPYADRSVDVVVSTWTLETLPDPRRAVREFLRVIKDDGFVIYAFSGKPAGGLARLYARLLEEWSGGMLHGRFLRAAEQPYHDCGRSRLMRFANGLATVVVLRKCCSVDDSHALCLPASAGRRPPRQAGLR